jgi:hypothetical protein
VQLVLALAVILLVAEVVLLTVVEHLVQAVREVVLLHYQHPQQRQ